MGSSKSTDTSASNPSSLTTVEGLLGYVFRTYRTLTSESYSGYLGEQPRDIQQAMFRKVGKLMRGLPLVHAPATLWDAAVFQGVLGWINDVSGIMGKDVIPPPHLDNDTASMSEMTNLLIATLDRLMQIPDSKEHIEKELNADVLPVTGVPYNGCLVGFDRPADFPLVVTDHDPVEYVSVLLITENLIVIFQADTAEDNQRMQFVPLYVDGHWISRFSGDRHIVHSLIQVLNLSTDQRELKQSLGFKRLAQRLAKQHGLEVRFTQVYNYPNGVKPPTRHVSVCLKVPGLRGHHFKETEVVDMQQKPTTVVEHFLALQAKVQHNTFNFQQGQGIIEPAEIAQAVRAARVFEIPLELYNNMYAQADRYVTEQIAGSEWGQANDTEVWATDQMTSMDFVQCINEAGVNIELPEKCPFEAFYLGYQPPPVISPLMFTMYGLSALEQERPIKQLELIGHLIAGPLVVSCMLIQFFNGRDMFSFAVEHKTEWYQPYTLGPWVITALIDWINDHQTVIQDGSKLPVYKQTFQKIRSQLHLHRDAPPLYYTVYMRDLVVNKSVRKTFTSRFKKTIDWSHRWEVRGHYMVRIKRGAAPLDVKLEKVLRKRKYQLFLDDAQVPFDVWQKLEARGVPPKKANEWLAVLVSFRQDFVKGPEDKPLVPSVRKSARYADGGDERSLFDDQDIDEAGGD